MREFSFENLLTSYRNRLGWTQLRVAEKLEVSLRTYWGWEKGERLPSKKMLQRIVGLFELNDAEADILYRVASEVAPEIHNLPFQRNPFFTGREAYLDLLDQHFKTNGSVATTQPICISGLGGIGKTQLALEYAHCCHPNVYRTVLWTNAADKATLEASYLSLASLLELPEKNERKVDRVVQAVKTWLERHTSWLLILDNVDDLQLARSFLPIKPRGHLLLTTQSQIVGNIAARIELEAMAPEEGHLFLLRRSGVLKDRTEQNSISSSIRKDAQQLVELLEGHPLAIDQAGAYIEETRDSFRAYMQLYSDQRLILLNKRGSLGDEHPETVAITFEISFQRACKQYPLAADVLYLCSFLHSNDIPEELLSQERRLKLNAMMLGQAIAALQRYSLIKRNAERKMLTVHRLVQTVLQDTMAEQDRKRWVEQVVQAVNTTLGNIETKPSSRPTTLRAWSLHRERYLPHLRACAKLVNDQHLVSREAAELLDRFAHELSFSSESYNIDEIIDALHKAIRMWEEVQGPNDLHIVDCLYGLIPHYIWLGRHKEVEELLKQVSAIEQNTDPEVLNAFPFRIRVMSGLTAPEQLTP